ncbi:Acyl-CoA synthetase (NDP forming) [Desulfocicer vacuolatum DSM 3385]|uniref:Acyl-CoA synthetase (NDP forming) n=1 Tax=Desulfocicer vacuolatum DSM 3385 TaxID=1121400 RepID=A0A1W2CXC0_9BACT|nr:acetate--CoA ligase family protein [Desulfocicer vacuolatum]SMC89905.1 Acyl-CoA synthetase (NDP forming) [Desulfocicer vacuolatum DSM 3385]
MQLFINFDKITHVFAQAASEGRFQLFEYETYEVLSALGSESVPRHHLLARNHRLTSELLAQFLEEKVVLKIVCQDVVHKSDVGGVKVVPRILGKVRSESRRMVDAVCGNFASFLEKNGNQDPSLKEYATLSRDELCSAINKKIKGVLISQFLPPESNSLGNELLVSLRWTREFGMVITAGLGGTDTELYAERFRSGQAVVSASTADVSGEAFFEIFKKTIAYEKLSGQTRGATRLISDEQLVECFSALIAVGNYFSPLNDKAPYIIEELEVNPYALVDYEMVPLDGLCRFSEPFSPRASRSVQRISYLLHPETVAVIGVSSTKENFGRNILQNMIKSGFPKDDITIVSPGAQEIDGVKCVKDITFIHDSDLIILAVGARQVPQLIDEIIDNHRAKSVILISGGLGETADSREKARQVVEKISKAHAREQGGPVFLGGNCLGVISRPGKLDSFFTPEMCSPKRRDRDAVPVALVSQSGAFGLVRMTSLVSGDPAYNITVGNQLDLTIGDCITWLADAKDIGVICVYVEGFQDLDGLHACRGIRKAVQNGKEVLVYKAGRTPEGKKATSGHTASVAGDYVVCTSCLRQAGALVADSLQEFDGLANMALSLHSKKMSGYKVGALSSAGFECVGVADALESRDSSLELPLFSTETQQRIAALFEQSGLANIMDVKNPLDITPAAPDMIYVESIKAMMQDEGIDIIVTSLGSLAPATSDILDPDSPKGFTTDKNSLTSLLPELMAKFEKPLVVFNDAGSAHEPINNWLRQQGIPIFNTSRQAMSLLARYTAYRNRIQS